MFPLPSVISVYTNNAAISPRRAENRTERIRRTRIQKKNGFPAPKHKALSQNSENSYGEAAPFMIDRNVENSARNQGECVKRSEERRAALFGSLPVQLLFRFLCGIICLLAVLFQAAIKCRQPTLSQEPAVVFLASGLLLGETAPLVCAQSLYNGLPQCGQSVISGFGEQNVWPQP